MKIRPVILLISFLIFPEVGICVTNKCIDKSGHVNYSDQPCRSDEIKQEEIISEVSTTNSNQPGKKTNAKVNELCRTNYVRELELEGIKRATIDENNPDQKKWKDERIRSVEEKIINLCSEPISRIEKFKEIIKVTRNNVKLAITMCIVEGVSASKCRTVYESLFNTIGAITGSENKNGTNTQHIKDSTYGSNYIGARTVLPEYKIYVEAIVGDGLNGETYILTPKYTSASSGDIKWVVSGTCVKVGLCDQE